MLSEVKENPLDLHIGIVSRKPGHVITLAIVKETNYGWLIDKKGTLMYHIDIKSKNAAWPQQRIVTKKVLSLPSSPFV